MPTKAQEFYELYWKGKPFEPLQFKSLTLKIGTYKREFENGSLPVTVRGGYLLNEDGKKIYAFTLDDFTTTFFEHAYGKKFFEPQDVVGFVKKK